MEGAAIEIEDLHVVRGGRPVLDGVSLHVASGSVKGLLGPGGCGKSTLMRTIVGVQIVGSGRVTVLGDRAGPLDALPLTYAYSALAHATCSGSLGGAMAVDVAVILGATLVALALGGSLSSAGLRERLPGDLGGAKRYGDDRHRRDIQQLACDGPESLVQTGVLLVTDDDSMRAVVPRGFYQGSDGITV